MSALRQSNLDDVKFHSAFHRFAAAGCLDMAVQSR
jgi:hypothetical protein